MQRLQLIQYSLARAVTRTPRRHHITPVLKSLHWLKIPECIPFKVLSLTCNSLQFSQPTYLYELFTVQPTRSALPVHPPVSSFLDPQSVAVTSHLTFSNRAISITAPRLWNNLPPELCALSLPPPSSLQITKHHLLPGPLSVTPSGFPLETEVSISISSEPRTLTHLTHLILFLPTLCLNYTSFNA